jgi:hypothetical protein
MTRVYRLSTVGAKLPKHHRYGPARTAQECEPGFEVFKGPIYSIANTIGPALGSLGEGDFTPAAGFNHMLLIDVRAFHGHRWVRDTWFVILPDDVEGVRRLAVADLHSWLRQQAACVSPDGQLDRDAVVAWVGNNRNLVERWLEEHSEAQPVEFVETLDVLQPLPRSERGAG